MTLFRSLPRSLSRPLAWTVVLAWVLNMGLLVKRSYVDAGPLSLAADLARYGTAAQWRGV